MTIKEDVQYYEEVPVHPAVRFILLLGTGILIFTGVEAPRSPKIILIPIAAVIVFIYLNFLTLTIIITSNRLMVRFGVIRQNIWLTDIELIETRHPPWYWYGGFGIRFGWDWSIGFVQNFKRGVRVTPKHGRRFFFSTDNPEALLNIVNDLKKKQADLQ